ncbi:sulfatase family protein [Roseibacillus persicicus]|uniref:sulfatase family protein n=1 Tax=Roseibacillus persicicus TaxID=454148 RepID=UPI00280CAAAE|nr:sulfatase-like hydrolase/transferase [Roseibacillus persicicus]MDQ8188666.1 sulfatase-like hydrolase/transferase [Roseibacillus persicicus]
MKLLPLLFLSFSLLASAAEKPNILFLLSDDQAWGDYSFMGHPHIETPHLDKLASQSLTFKRGYTPVPLCRPSLASILTGLHPHQHQVTGNDVALPQEAGNPQLGRKDPRYAEQFTEVTAQWGTHPNWIRSLKESGYRSLQTGKWWEGRPVEEGDFTQGMTFGTPDKGGRHGDAGLDIGRKGIQPIKDFVQASGDQPWFVWYGVFLPHTPHNPPQELLDKYLKKTDNPNIAAYWACCEWLDQTIGELMSFLEESGELENTLIIYTCDNGWIQDPERLNRFNPRSKQTVYEGGIRTPILFSWKDRIQPRIDDINLASNLDIWPTAAALCDTPLPEGLTGIDLTKFAEVENRTAIYGADYSHDMVELGSPEKSLEFRYIIDGDWKLIQPHAPRSPEAQPELYNLKNDPHEKENLVARQPDRAKALLTKLNAWWTPKK